MVLAPQVLVAARLYPSQDAVIEDALRSLLQEKPQLRIELAIYRYQTEDISLAKAANLAGVSFLRPHEGADVAAWCATASWPSGRRRNS